MKNQKGITLIALVITIIVLLILAGVSIAMLTGENGLLTQATSAKDETKIAEIAENVQISISAAYAAYKNPNTPVKFTIDSIVNELKATTGNDGHSGTGTTITYKDTTGDYTVTLTADLKAIATDEETGDYEIAPVTSE